MNYQEIVAQLEESKKKIVRLQVVEHDFPEAGIRAFMLSERSRHMADCAEVVRMLMEESEPNRALVFRVVKAWCQV